MRKRIWLLPAAAFLALILSACSGSGTEPAPAEEPAAEETAAPSAEVDLIPAEPRVVPLEAAAFHEDMAEGSDGVLIDLSATESGYFAISASSDSRLKVQVLKDDETYTYDIASDGTVSIFPLQCGDGSYLIRVMENVADSKYAELYSTTCDVALHDEFQPYIRSNDYVSYDQRSECVELAARLAGGAESAPEVVAAVYEFICDNIVYDNEKATMVGSGYMPTPDATLSEGRGICFDYASLTAAMLRSQGIPTQVIFGYVSPDDLYHAWNMFYTEETGWVTVDFEVKADSWNRLDLTFAANGAGNDFIGDGGNYADLYKY